MELSGGCVQQRARHPEVNQESPSRLEPNDQVLAATIDDRDGLTVELTRDLVRVERTREPRVENANVLESPPLQDRRERPPDRLYLGQLRHARTVAAGSGVSRRAPTDRA